MPSNFPKVVVTGFCAAHAHLGGEQNAWLEYSSTDAPELRQLFDVSSAQKYFAREKPGPDGFWPEKFFSSGVIGVLEASGLWAGDRLSVDPARVGICFSSSKGLPARWEKVQGISPADGCDWALRALAELTRARGKRLCPVAACAGGAHAIAIGAQWIEAGLCDVVLCGAIEPELAELMVAGYRSLGALSSGGVMRPFDCERDGFVPSSGAACLVLESEGHARKRRAEIFGAVAGWSMLNDATSMTGLDPSGQTIARAISEASARRTRRKRRSAGAMQYVNAHGTATRMNDEVEARAINLALGHRTPVSSTKPLTGHLLGAAGAVEAVLCLLAMQQSFVPPNLNLQRKDRSCNIDVVETGRSMEIDTALSLNYGFGGHIGVLVLEKE